MSNKRLMLLPLALLLAGCGDRIKNSTLYGIEYVPPRQFESSVLNEPDAVRPVPNAGRPYRVNGSGYGPERPMARAGATDSENK